MIAARSIQRAIGTKPLAVRAVVLTTNSFRGFSKSSMSRKADEEPLPVLRDLPRPEYGELHAPVYNPAEKYKEQIDRCRPTDYRKDYQKECTSEVGDSGHENITESTYYQR